MTDVFLRNQIVQEYNVEQDFFSNRDIGCDTNEPLLEIHCLILFTKIFVKIVVKDKIEDDFTCQKKDHDEEKGIDLLL